jgi:hypothetical protein
MPPFKGFGSLSTIVGIEEFISMTITGEQTELVIDPGALNTAPTVTTYYNPRYNVSIEGISDGSSIGDTFILDGKTYIKTGESLSKTVGDVVKVSVTGVHNPNSTIGT